MQYSQILSFIMLMVFSLSASANFAVSPMQVDLGGPKNLNKQDFILTNESDEKAFIKVIPKVMVNPGTKEAKLVNLGSPKESGLLVSPRKVMIPPKQTRMVRVVLTKPSGKTERSYRIQFKPVKAKARLKKVQGKENLAVRILVGYAVKVFVRPVKENKSVRIERKGKAVTLKNTGNVSYILKSIPQCEKAICTKIEKGRIYPGNTWDFTLPLAKPIKFNQYYQVEKDEVSSN